MCQRCDQIREEIKKWILAQGHNKCWYYPEILKKIQSILGLEDLPIAILPTEKQFEEGCSQFRKELFHESQLRNYIIESDFH